MKPQITGSKIPLVNATLLNRGIPQTAYYIGWLFSNASIMYLPDGKKWVTLPCDDEDVPYLQEMDLYFNGGRHLQHLPDELFHGKLTTGGEKRQILIENTTKYRHLVNIPVLNGKHTLRIRDTNLCSWLEQECGVTRYKKDRADVPQWLVETPAFWRGVVDSSGIIHDNKLRILTTGKMVDSIAIGFTKWLKPEWVGTSMSPDDNNPPVLTIGDAPRVLAIMYRKDIGITSEIPERFNYVIDI